MRRCIKIDKKGNSIPQVKIGPCVFSEEEFDEEIKASEQSGFAKDDEVRAAFAKWGIG